MSSNAGHWRIIGPSISALSLRGASLIRLSGRVFKNEGNRDTMPLARRTYGGFHGDLAVRP